MKQLQKRLYQLLLEIDEVCHENDILYYLSAGCALGAIRQGKFIYWDDDIDVFLTRDNWEKLRTVFETKCPENRKLIHKDNAPYYGNTIARYVDLDTLAFRRSMLLCPEAMCVAVEIFILDPFPTEARAQKEHIKNLKLYSELLNPFMILNTGNTETELDFDYTQYKEYRKQIETQGEESVLKTLEAKITSTSDEDCDTYCMRWGRIPYLFTKELIGTGRMEWFEGHEFPVMQFAERSFRTGYGDSWMYLPEVSGAAGHNDIVDLDFDHTERYTLSEEERQTLRAEYLQRKTINIDKMQIERARDKALATMQGAFASRKLKEENKEGELLDALAKGDYAALNNVFAAYYELIHDSRIKGHHVQIELPDDLFYTAMMNLIMQGRYYSIPAYLTDAFDSIGNEAYRKELRARYDFCRQLSIAIYDERNSAKARVILAENAQYEDMLDFHRSDLWVMIQEAEETEDYTAIIDKAQKSIERFGEDGELLCYQAEAMHFLDDQDGARELFEKGIRKTRNGFLLRRAEELCGVEITADALGVYPAQYTPAGCLFMEFHKFCMENHLSYYLTGIKNGDDISLSRDHHFEVAMSHDDLGELKEAVERRGGDGDARYELEYVNDIFGELNGKLRLYDRKTCVVDIRNDARQTETCSYITIQEIERFGERQNRDIFDIMRSVWIEHNPGKFANKRRKLRLTAKGAAMAEAVLSEKAKKNILRKYRQRHFTIPDKELVEKNCQLRIGPNMIASGTLKEADFIALGPCIAPVLWECRKRAQDAPRHAIRELRYQILDAKKSFAQVFTDQDEADLMECCNLQRDIDDVNETIAAGTKNIKASWKQLKRQIIDLAGQTR